MDPRIQRTRRSLQDALIQLCKKRDLGDVSVSEVSEAAGVNRTTFYQHYPDIDTLLADALDAIAIEASAQIEVDIAAEGSADASEIIRKYLQHVHDNASLYRKVLNSAESPVTVTRLTERVAAIAEAGMRASQLSEERVPISIAAASMAGGFVGMVRAWLRLRPLPAAEIATEWAMITLGLDVGEVSLPRKR